MAGVVNIPWYSTVFRGDRVRGSPARDRAGLACATGRPTSRSCAPTTTATASSSSRTGSAKGDFEAYWYGPEFSEWRADYTSWYQVPVIYSWFDRVIAGELERNGVDLAGAPPHALE